MAFPASYKQQDAPRLLCITGTTWHQLGRAAAPIPVLKVRCRAIVLKIVLHLAFAVQMAPV